MLGSGEKLSLGENLIKTGKHLSFTADLDDIGNGRIIIAHGYMVTHGSWIEITGDTVSCFSYYYYAKPPLCPTLKEPAAHGLKIRDFLTVNIEAYSKSGGCFAQIMTSSGLFRLDLPGWCANEGEVMAMPEGVSLKNCRLNWFSEDFSKDIWIVGDSYLGFTSKQRWPYYLFRDGYKNALLMGFPGMNAERGIEEFKKWVEYQTPTFAVWCLGMNNLDPEDKANEGYVAATAEFLGICKKKGITPILSTTPNTPKRISRHKNAWVRSLGVRYIDFNRAVGADKILEWYPDMLSADLVHPDELGAKALYMQVLTDFPEIMHRF